LETNGGEVVLVPARALGDLHDVHAAQLGGVPSGVGGQIVVVATGAAQVVGSRLATTAVVDLVGGKEVLAGPPVAVGIQTGVIRQRGLCIRLRAEVGTFDRVATIVATAVAVIGGFVACAILDDQGVGRAVVGLHIHVDLELPGALEHDEAVFIVAIGIRVPHQRAGIVPDLYEELILAIIVVSKIHLVRNAEPVPRNQERPVPIVLLVPKDDPVPVIAASWSRSMASI
jgi:hypothetical protein